MATESKPEGLHSKQNEEVVPVPEIIKPQQRQEDFLSNSADIVIFGG